MPPNKNRLRILEHLNVITSYPSKLAQVPSRKGPNLSAHQEFPPVIWLNPHGVAAPILPRSLLFPASVWKGDWGVFIRFLHLRKLVRFVSTEEGNSFPRLDHLQAKRIQVKASRLAFGPGNHICTPCPPALEHLSGKDCVEKQAFHDRHWYLSTWYQVGRELYW